MNIIEQFEKNQINKSITTKKIPNFSAGDTVKVTVKLIDKTIEKDGTEKLIERFQFYEGVVIAKRKSGIASSFVVRKISHGEGVERRFMMYSPIVHAIDLVREGVVRRAKLYYLRARSGKAARIKEKIRPRNKAVKQQEVA